LLKGKYKLFLLRTIIKNEEIDCIALIRQAIAEVETEATKNCAGTGRREIEKVILS
jgi:hypothetical protein